MLPQGSKEAHVQASNILYNNFFYSGENVTEIKNAISKTDIVKKAVALTNWSRWIVITGRVSS